MSKKPPRGLRGRLSHVRRWGTISLWFGFFAWGYPLGLIFLPVFGSPAWLIALREHGMQTLIFMVPSLVTVALVAGQIAKNPPDDSEFSMRERHRAYAGRRFAYWMLIVIGLTVFLSMLTA